jgi:hypothetical protein
MKEIPMIEGKFKEPNSKKIRTRRSWESAEPS